jgi:hypothetical protein
MRQWPGRSFHRNYRRRRGVAAADVAIGVFCSRKDVPCPTAHMYTGRRRKYCQHAVMVLGLCSRHKPESVFPRGVAIGRAKSASLYRMNADISRCLLAASENER